MKKNVIVTLNKYKKVLRGEKEGKWHFNKWINCIKYTRNLFYLYDNIKIISMEFHAFGETLPRLYTLMKDIEGKNKREIYVILPRFSENYESDIPNKRMMDLFSDKILFIKEDNIDYWKFIVLHHWNKLDLSEYWSYVGRRVGSWEVKIEQPGIRFLPEFEKEGINKFSSLEITEPFICIHVRDKGVMKLWNNKTESGIRECDISTYYKTCYLLKNMGIATVKMGKFEEKDKNNDSMIDYAGKMQDDLMDFYLMSKCKFVLGTDSGLSGCAAFFGRPVLMTNLIHLVSYWESMPYTEYDLMILKKMWSKEKQRYLNLKEMFEMEAKCFMYSSNYKVAGIVIEDNSEDEILEAALEMNSKLDGTWKISSEEVEYQRRVRTIFEDWKMTHTSYPMRRILRMRGYTMAPINICYTFLKKNAYLLEEM